MPEYRIRDAPNTLAFADAESHKPVFGACHPRSANGSLTKPKRRMRRHRWIDTVTQDLWGVAGEYR